MARYLLIKLAIKTKQALWMTRRDLRIASSIFTVDGNNAYTETSPQGGGACSLEEESANAF